jgi:hypothetical protein
MKRFYAFAIVIALLSLSAYAGAAVAVSKDGVYAGEFTTVNAGRGITGSYSGSTATFAANGHKEGVTTNVSDESTLTSAALSFGYIIRTQDSPSDITVGLDDGAEGQMITIMLTAKAGGSYIISETSFPVTTHATGWSILTFDTAGDSVTLLWLDDTYGWVVISNDGVTITQ